MKMCLMRFNYSDVTSISHWKDSNNLNVYTFNCSSLTDLLSLINSIVYLTNKTEMLNSFSLKTSVCLFPVPRQKKNTFSPGDLKKVKSCTCKLCEVKFACKSIIKYVILAMLKLTTKKSTFVEIFEIPQEASSCFKLCTQKISETVSDKTPNFLCIINILF